MSQVAEALRTVLAAAGVFAGTNIDDLVMLTVLFLSGRASGRPRRWQIWVGQYAGIGVLVGLCAVAALGLAVVADPWVGLLGLVPVTLGVRGLVTAIRSRDDDRPRRAVTTGAASVAAVTIANGADNLAVYTPMFRTIGVSSSLVTVAVFAVLVAAWCVAGSWLGSHPALVAAVRRFGHWLVPVVFVAVGLAVIAQSGVASQPL